MRTLTLIVALCLPLASIAQGQDQSYRSGLYDAKADVDTVVVWHLDDYNTWQRGVMAEWDRCRWFLDGREVRRCEVPDAVRVRVLTRDDGVAIEVRAKTR